MLKVYPVEVLGNVKNEELRQRVKRASSGRSCEYIAEINEREVALLSLEDWSHKGFGFIYEVYVLPEFRKQGIGESLVTYAEGKAKSLGCLRIQLEPRAFDHLIDSNWLVSWYAKQGYAISKNNRDHMEKSLV